MEPMILIRYSAPTKLDTAPMNSICEVTSQSGEKQRYKQLSQNEEEPNWQLIE